MPEDDDYISRNEREVPMSEYFKDVLALVTGTALVMLVWLAIVGAV